MAAPLVDLAHYVRKRREYADLMETAIARAYESGHTSEEIGRVIGLPRTTTHNRFRHLVPTARRRAR